MILKALYDYYIRCIENDSNYLPPFGFDTAEIAYVIVISKNGKFLRLTRCEQTDDGKHYVPTEPVTRRLKFYGIRLNMYWASKMK